MTVHHTRGTTLACIGLVVLLLPRLCAAYLGIEPLRTELSAALGETIEGQITLTNEKEVPVDIEVSFRDRSASRENHSDWIEIDTGEQHLDSRGTAIVTYRISVPEDTAGEFFGRVGFSEVSESSPGTVSIQTKISVPPKSPSPRPSPAGRGRSPLLLRTPPLASFE